MSRLLAVCCMTFLLFALTVKADSHGGEVPDACTDFGKAMENVMPCLSDLAGILSASTDKEKCKALENGLLCLAEKLNTGNDSACAAAMMDTLIGTPSLLTNALAEYSITLDLNPSTCKSDETPVCKDAVTILATAATPSDCKSKLQIALYSTDDTVDQCKMLHDGLECLADKASTMEKEKEVCVMAMMRYIMEDLTRLTDNVPYTTSLTLDITTCIKKPDDVCEDVNHAIAKLTTEHAACIDKFALILVSNDPKVQCIALDNGLKCLAEGLVEKDEVPECVAKMMAVLIRHPEYVTEAIKVIDPNIELNLNISDCATKSKCSDVDGIILQSLSYDDCRNTFALIMSSETDQEIRCLALRRGFRCLASKLVPEKEVDLCAYYMQRIVLMDPNKVKDSIKQTGLSTEGFDLNTTSCYNCPKILDECPKDQCDDKRCQRFQGARCRRNVCGGCTPRFVEEESINSEDGDDVSHLCTCDGPIVRCVADPCSVATCAIKNAKCRSNYCGGCNHNYFLGGRDVTDKCNGTGCPSQDKPCTTMSCSGPQSCKRNKDAECEIDKCTCKEVYVYYNKPVNCDEFTTKCRKEKMRLDADEEEYVNNQANGNGDQAQSRRPAKVTCNAKGDYVSKCNGDKCECLNAKTGVPARNKLKGNQNINCSDVQAATSPDIIFGKATLSKIKKLAELAESTKKQLLAKFEELARNITKALVKFRNLKLISGSIIVTYEAVAADGSDISPLAVVDGMNEDIENNDFPSFVVNGTTYTLSDGIVTETSPQTQEPITPDDDDDDDKKTIIIVVVVVVVAVLLVALAVGCYCFRKSETKGGNDFTDIQGHSNMGYKMQP